MLLVSITGTLSIPRKEAADLIDSTSNARFHADVTSQTNYLVATLFGSSKARKAARWGTAIITEAEMMEFVRAGAFPDNRLPDRPPHASNFPEIQWTQDDGRGFPYFIEYEGSDGVVTQRYIWLKKEGRATNGQDYIGAYDGVWFKTFRRDRIRRMERI